jgi:hypothetical protein
MASLTNHASNTECSMLEEMPARNRPASSTSYTSLRTIRLCTMNTTAHTMEPRFLPSHRADIATPARGQSYEHPNSCRGPVQATRHAHARHSPKDHTIAASGYLPNLSAQEPANAPNTIAEQKPTRNRKEMVDEEKGAPVAASVFAAYTS